MLIHDKAIHALTPTDYHLIEKEHNALERYLSDLRNACTCSNLDNLSNTSRCDHEKQSSCQGRLPSFLFHIIDLATSHFTHEEEIMLSRPHVTEDYEYFRIHRQAHADILQKLQALVDACFSQRNMGEAPEIYHRFYYEISGLFEEHDHQFDDPFIDSTKKMSRPEAKS